jgi:hypothetical protein
MAETLTTETEAVNTMLACIGEAPINTLLGDLPASIQIAVDLLRETSRRIQLKGWHFNKEEEYELSRNGDNEVQLPANTLACDLTIERGDVDLVQRGLFLYDRKNHTYELDFNPEATITFFLSWDELPEAARNYIKIKAARIYQDQTVGSTDHHRFTQQDEAESYADFVGAEAEAEDASIFDAGDCISGIVMRKPVQTTQF